MADFAQREGHVLPLRYGREMGMTEFCGQSG